jgi:hypothetical protein
MALSVLNDCYSKDEEKAELLLIKKVPQFGNLTSLQVAISANDQTFVSHPCVQGLLTKIWYNKIMTDTPKLQVSCFNLVKIFANIFLFRLDFPYWFHQSRR